MKYFHLIWGGLWRRRTRTVLTSLCVIVAFLLIGVLQGLNHGMAAFVGKLNLDRLYVMNRISMLNEMPLSAMRDIEKVPGVEQVAYWGYFAGYFRDQRNRIGVVAADVATVFAMYPELKIDPAQLQAMARTRTGAIVSNTLAQRFGWKPGDRVPMQTSIWTNKSGSRAWYFDVVGIYERSGQSALSNDLFFINYDFFDDERAWSNGTVHLFMVKVDDPSRATSISKAIDALFVNSSSQTRTRSERAYAQAQLRQIGDMSLIANSIVGAVLFTLLFVTANTMMQAVRERIPEFAVLKTLGYSESKVLTLVLIEALLLCVVAALIGLGIATVIFSWLATALFGSVSLPPVVLLVSVGLAVLIAVMSGLPAAWKIKRLDIVDALAGR